MYGSSRYYAAALQREASEFDIATGIAASLFDLTPAEAGRRLRSWAARTPFTWRWCWRKVCAGDGEAWRIMSGDEVDA